MSIISPGIKNNIEKHAHLFVSEEITEDPILLSRILSKLFMKYAACTAASFNNNEEWVKPFNLRMVKPWPEKIFLNHYVTKQLKPHDFCFFDCATGLKVALFVNDKKEVVIAFGAYGSGASEVPEEKRNAVCEKQYAEIKKNLMGDVPSLYLEALGFVEALMVHPDFKGKQFSLCGQSMGGSLAEFVGLFLQIPTYCFNPVMLGSGLLKTVPPQNLAESHEFVHIVSVENDFASDLFQLEAIFRVAKVFDLPRHHGCKHVIPTAYPSMIDRHIYLVGSMMTYLGYSYKAHTTELKDCDVIPHLLEPEEIQEEIFTAATCFNELVRLLFIDASPNRLNEVLKIIRVNSNKLYSFLCFLVWHALGKKDFGDKDWGEKRLQENPQLLKEIRDAQGNRFIDKIIVYYQFLACVLNILHLQDLSEIVDFVRTDLGIKDFSLNHKNLPLFILKVTAFLSDQLRNGFGEEMRNILAADWANVCSWNPPPLPKTSLLARCLPLPVEAPQIKRILMISVEYKGILKVGGLAEAVAGMAGGLKALGHDVTLLMPKFDRFPHDGKGEVAQSLKVTKQTIEHHFGCPRVDRVFRGAINGIKALFIENAKGRLFDLGETGVYKIAGDNSEATKLKERFAYFASAIASLIHQMRGQFDVVLFNDWHGALAIHLLVQRFFDTWMNGMIPSLVYVFHNNGYAAQGILNSSSKDLFEKVGLHRNYLNVAEESLQYADHVVTVSPTYAEEVQKREANGLEMHMRRLAHLKKLTGILNGANPDAWNPETDPMLMNWNDPETGAPCPLNYGTGDDLIEAKKAIKVQAQKWLETYYPEYIEQYGVDLTRDKILLYVGRLDRSQKGLEKFRQAMLAAKECKATMIVMGPYEEGAASIMSSLRNEAADLKSDEWGGALILEDRYNEVGKLDFQQGTVKKSIRGQWVADKPGAGSLLRALATFGFFPSIYEPCGLVQFETWLFGGLVIASRVGGLADTVTQDATDPLFNGFTFQRLDAWDSKEQDEEIRRSVKNAFDTWDAMPKKRQQKIMADVMERARLSGWTSSAELGEPSPIENYERVIQAASISRHKRTGIQPVSSK